MGWFVFRGALVGAAVTFALIAIPVVHFVTFIPSPLIGGYFAGARTTATPGQAFVIGPLMGLLLVVPVAAILSVASLLFLDLPTVTIVVIAGVYATYVAALGSLGAVWGGASARRNAAS